MIPGSLAKLALRLIAAGILFLYFPGQAISLFGYVAFFAESLSQGGADVADSNGIFLMLMVVGALAAEVLAVALIWFYAEGLSKFLLPVGTVSAQAVNYNEWERWGLVFIGSWLILKGCLGIPMLIFGNMVYTGDHRLVVFNLIAGLFFISGLRTISGAFKRILHLTGQAN